MRPHDDQVCRESRGLLQDDVDRIALHNGELSRTIPGLRLPVQPVGADVKGRHLGPELPSPGRRERSRAPGELREIDRAEDAPDSIHICTIRGKKTRRPQMGGDHSYMHHMPEWGRCQAHGDLRGGSKVHGKGSTPLRQADGRRNGGRAAEALITPALFSQPPPAVREKREKDKTATPRARRGGAPVAPGGNRRSRCEPGDGIGGFRSSGQVPSTSSVGVAPATNPVRTSGWRTGKTTSVPCNDHSFGLKFWLRSDRHQILIEHFFELLSSLVVPEDSVHAYSLTKLHHSGLLCQYFRCS